IVREAILWLGMADPCITREKVEADDTEHENLAALLTSWYDTFNDKGYRVSEVLQHITRLDGPEPLSEDERENLTALKAAITTVAAERDKINAQQFAAYIGKSENRIANGLRFERKQQSKKTHVSPTWHVRPFGVSTRPDDGPPDAVGQAVGARGSKGQSLQEFCQLAESSTCQVNIGESQLPLT